MDFLGVLYALGAAITWGLVYTIDQKILLNFSPLTLLFVDSILTALIFIPFFIIDKEQSISILKSGKINIILIVVSLILAIIANLFIYSGIQRLGASLAAVFEISYPMFVVLFSYIFFRTNVSFSFWMGALLIFIGSLIILKY